MKNIISEPYRIFFPLGILMGIYGISHWLFFALGWIPTYSVFSHASIQIQGYMGCFVLGFLLTAMPRFAGAPHATLTELLFFLVLTVGGVFLQSLGQIALAEGTFLVWLLALLRFAYVRFRQKKVIHPPVEFIWIPIGVFHAVIGALLIIAIEIKLAPAWMMEVGKPLILQGFILSVVLGVGGFLAPRLMGRSEIIKRYETGEVEKFRSRQKLVYLFSGALLFSSFWIEGLGHKSFGYGLRAFLIILGFIRNHVFPYPPRVRDGYVKLLVVSLWMIVLGYAIIPFFPAYRAVLLHLVFLGGYSLMTFAVGTMVIISHAGLAPRLKERLVSLEIVALGLGIALILRISAVFFPAYYFVLLGASSASWLTTAMLWLGFMIPYLGKIPASDAFERSHEEMKQRIQSC